MALPGWMGMLRGGYEFEYPCKMCQRYEKSSASVRQMFQRLLGRVRMNTLLAEPQSAVSQSSWENSGNGIH